MTEQLTDDQRQEILNERLGVISQHVQINPLGVVTDVIVNRLWPGPEGREEFKALLLEQWESVADMLEQQLTEQGIPLTKLTVPDNVGRKLVLP